MKAYAVVLVVLVVVGINALTPELKQKIKETRQACEESSKVDQGIVRKSRQGTFENDDKLKDYLLCYFKKFGVQNASGDLQKEAIKTTLAGAVNATEVDKLIKECLLKKSTPQETALEYAKCSHKYIPKQLLEVN